MKKILLGVITLLILSGCSNTASGSKKDATSTSNTTVTSVQSTQESSGVTKNLEANFFGDPVIIDGLEVSITSLDVSEYIDKSGEEETLYMFSLKVKNIQSAAKAMGAIDFKLITSDDKEHTISTSMEAFGKEIAKDATIEERLYFTLTPDEKATALVYAPQKKVLKTWELTK